MPLIMLCGGPLSGKSFIAEQLAAACRTLYPEKEVKIISYDSMNVQRNNVYNNMSTEKPFNQRIISMVEQLVTPRRLVIVDVLCLTKSLRYQFYGKANFAGTVSSVVHCTTPYETTLERNATQNIYTTATFEDLWNRFEEPQDTCRWDHPLFHICIQNQEEKQKFEQQRSQQQQQPQQPLQSPSPHLFDTIVHAVCAQSTKNVAQANIAKVTNSGVMITHVDTVTTFIVSAIAQQQTAQGYVLGAMLQNPSLTVQIDITALLSPSTSTPPPTTEPPAEQLPVDSSDALPTTVAPTTSTGGLKLVRKTVRGAKRGTPNATTSATQSNVQSPDAQTPDQNEPTQPVVFQLVLGHPFDNSSLLEFKQSFTRIAVMMKLTSIEQISKAFVDYLIPQLRNSNDQTK